MFISLTSLSTHRFGHEEVKKKKNGANAVIGFRVDSRTTGLNGLYGKFIFFGNSRALSTETMTLKHQLMLSSISRTWIWTLYFLMRAKKKKNRFDSTGFYHQWAIRDISTALSFQQPVLEISILKCLINIKRDVKSISGIDHCGIICFQLSVTLADSDRCLMTNIIHRPLRSAICSWFHKNEANLGLLMTQKGASNPLCHQMTGAFTTFRT